MTKVVSNNYKNKGPIFQNKELLHYLQSDLSLTTFVIKNNFVNNGCVNMHNILPLVSLSRSNYMGKLKNALKKLGIEKSILVPINNGRKVEYALPLKEAVLVFEHVARKKLVYEYGVNDVEGSIYLDNGKIKPCYRKWCGMLERCYSEKWHIKKPSYKNCHVSPEWLYFSSFKKWFDENNVEGYVLDKDILVKNNQEYSSNKCIFIPEFINTLFIKRQGDRGGLPIGVMYSKIHKKYIARISANNKRITVGYLDCPNEAFLAYKKAKEDYIKEVADEYFGKGLINSVVYDALCKYDVSIDD